MEGFLRYRVGGLYLEGLIHGGAYFRNFSVSFTGRVRGHARPRDFFLCPKKTGARYSAYRFSQVRSSMSSLEKSERIS